MSREGRDAAWKYSEGQLDRLLVHVTPKNTCEHEWGGWREFPDGNGGEQVCKKCGLGAMADTLSKDF